MLTVKSSCYVKGAAKYGQCIVSNLPQIAVVGKSNVGKSSFINLVTGDGKLARVSKQPGRTRLINYFLLKAALPLGDFSADSVADGEGTPQLRESGAAAAEAPVSSAETIREFFLVDLPGYGFAKVSDAEKLKWAELLENYLAKEKMLKHVFFLVDIRHEPTKDDVTMYNYLFRNNVSFTVVATKSDKVSKSQVKNRCRAIANFLKVGEGNVISVSSPNKVGKEAVFSRIEIVLRNSDFC